MELNVKAAYELPPNFDLDQLLRLVTAKRDEAQDSIWALREDPSYFRDVLEEESGLFREISHKVCKAVGISIPSDSDRHLFNLSCQGLVEDFYIRLMLWDLLLFGLGTLRSLRSTLDGEQLRGNLWGADYMEGAERFTVSFWTIYGIALGQLQKAASMSRLMRKYWTFHLDQHGPTSYLDPADRDKWPSMVVLIDELFDTSKRYQMGAPKIMDEMKRTMRAEPSQADLVTSTVASRLSGVAAFGEIENSLRRHRPYILPKKEIKTDT